MDRARSITWSQQSQRRGFSQQYSNARRYHSPDRSPVDRKKERLRGRKERVELVCALYVFVTGRRVKLPVAAMVLTSIIKKDDVDDN
ncbi:hypothetical protein AgCh_008281 [Apium graveolens]